MGSYAMTTLSQEAPVPILAFRASNCLVTTSTVLSDSRSSRDSPQHQITPMPASVAHLVLLATTSSLSHRMVRRSEWPRIVQVILLSFSWDTEISPVKAPLGLSKTFCAATSM